MRRLLLLIVCILARAEAGPLPPPATITWDGAGSDLNFSTAGNWLGGAVPANGDNLLFVNLADPNLQNITFDSAKTIGNISFTGIRNGYYINAPKSGLPPSLTLSGNISTDTASVYWGVFGIPLILSNGSHTFSTGAADLYFFAPISGGGSVIKTGASNLILTQDNSSWTGGLTVNQGNVYVSDDHALGAGTVTFTGGAIAGTGNYTDSNNVHLSVVSLANNFLVGANPVFGTNAFPDPISLALSGTLAPVSGVSSVNFSLVGTQPLYLKGALLNGAAATSYSFSNGNYILSGGNTYTGTTTVVGDTQVIFDGLGSVLNLAAGSITTTTSGGYVGLGSDSTVTDVTGFLSKLNHTSFSGTIGFDQQSFANPFKGTVDLSGFNTPGVTIGTQTTATLYGPIIPQSGGSYGFAGHGTLFLGDEPAQASYSLGGSYDLNVSTPATDGKPFLLVLGRSSANSYTGSTTLYDHSGISLDAAGALPANSPVYLDYGAYLGATDTSGITLAALTGKLANVDPNSVIGFDSHNVLNNLSSTPVTVTNLDLSSVSAPFYVGTATKVIFNGTLLTASSNTGNYYFAGFGSGQVQVDAALTGAKSVNLGLAGAVQTVGDTLPSVKLTNAANTYSGGTVLNSGRLILDDPRALGTGGLTVNATASDAVAYLETGAASLAISAPLVLQSGELHLPAATALSLSGNISNAGSLFYGNPGGTLVLSGNNDYSGGTVLDNQAAVTAASDTAFGPGSLELRTASGVTFTTTAPSIGSLLNGSSYYDTISGNTLRSSLALGGAGPTTLTINQTQDANFDGDIRQTSSPVSLVKTGPSTLALTGSNNNYSGGTTIAQGKLVAGTAGSLGTGAVTINGGTFSTGTGVVIPNPIGFGPNGGTISGNGVISSPITVAQNVTLSPGNSPGILTFNAGLTLAGAGSLIMEVESAAGAAGVGYDTVDVSGGTLDITATPGSPFEIKLTSLTLSGTAGNVADFSAGSSYSWMFFTGNTTGGITNFASNKFVLDTSAFSNSLSGGSFSLVQGVYGGNPALFLNFTPVPEPSTYALLILGLASLATTALRRRRS